MKDHLLLAVCIVISILNFVSFIAYGVDKHKARKGSFRIPEATLLLFAALGPVGALAGMYVFHHKTKKPKFFIGVPLIIVLEIAAAVAIFILSRK